MSGTSVLYYFHDPMCSWCWAFRPVWRKILSALPDSIQVRYILGGLAADTDEVMPEVIQTMIKRHWRRIQCTVPGIEFNYSFWLQCRPRRATYPACRAVIAARMQGDHYEQAMILAIQQAYYLQARNPSDTDVLFALSRELGLDEDLFKRDLNSLSTQKKLLEDIDFCRSCDVPGFPCLVFERSGRRRMIVHSYTDPQIVLAALPQSVD